MSATPVSSSPAPGTLPLPSRLIQRSWHRIRYVVRDEGREAGFTVLEAVVSFVLFAIVIAGATTGIVNSNAAAHNSQQRVDAANIAQQYVASIRANRKLVRSGTLSLSPAPIGSESFSATQTIAFDSAGITQCPSGSTGTMFTAVVKVYSSTGSFLARSDARVLC